LQAMYTVVESPKAQAGVCLRQWSVCGGAVRAELVKRDWQIRDAGLGAI